jgi:hypothetical protein
MHYLHSDHTASPESPQQAEDRDSSTVQQAEDRDDSTAQQAEDRDSSTTSAASLQGPCVYTGLLTTLPD